MFVGVTPAEIKGYVASAHRLSVSSQPPPLPPGLTSSLDHAWHDSS